MITSSMLYFTFNSHQEKPSVLDNVCFYTGALVALRGLYLEAKSDNQLEEWKFAKANGIKREVDPNNKEEVEKQKLREKFHRNCIDGLWAKTRHPNLYYELNFWFGLALSSVNLVSNPISLLAFGGPMFLTLIMKRLTIPLTEKTMKPKREEYWDEYVKSYPSLVPRGIL